MNSSATGSTVAAEVYDAFSSRTRGTGWTR